jgi:hypothetical protein
MKGIYLTEEAKKEIEAIIENLKKPAPHWDGVYVSDKMEARSELYEEILSSATILPVHEDWEKCVHYTLVPFFENDLPNGVIIEKNKQS